MEDKHCYVITKRFISSSKISFNAFRVDDGDDINARMNQQKTFEIGKTFFKSEKTFHRQTYFPKQNSKNWERFLKIPGNPYKGTKKNERNSHKRKQRTR